MNNLRKPKRAGYAFITHYLLLLALPMVIGLGGVIVQFQLFYRDAIEQKLSSLNHAIALSEEDTLNSFEQVVALSVASDRLRQLDQTNDSRDYYRQLWNEQTRLNTLIGTIFFADSGGKWFSSNADLDLLLSDGQNPAHRLDPLARPWFKGALSSPGNPVWSLPYADMRNQNQIMTVSYSLVAQKDPGLRRVLGVDVNLDEWSKKISSLTKGDNAVRHLLLDRASGEVLLHSNSSRVGSELKQSWRPLLIGQSGSFFMQEAGYDGEYVAYEALPSKANWIAITVQSRRDSLISQQLNLVLVIIAFSGCLFFILAIVFRQRLAGIIDTLIMMVRQLRLSPDRESLVLPAIPGLADLNIEMGLISDHLQENIDRANRDGLTGLYNRRYLNEKLAQLQAQQTPVVLALIDIDNFKRINDTFGHALGDTVLRRVAAMGLESLSKEATLYRYGGEELVAIFERDNLEEAELQLERWRLDVAKAQWREAELIVTFSAGIGANEGQTVEALLKMVDQALYRAKEDGKNRTYRAA